MTPVKPIGAGELTEEGAAITFQYYVTFCPGCYRALNVYRCVIVPEGGNLYERYTDAIRLESINELVHVQAEKFRHDYAEGRIEKGRELHQGIQSHHTVDRAIVIEFMRYM